MLRSIIKKRTRWPPDDAGGSFDGLNFTAKKVTKGHHDFYENRNNEFSQKVTKIVIYVH